MTEHVELCLIDSMRDCYVLKGSRLQTFF